PKRSVLIRPITRLRHEHRCRTKVVTGAFAQLQKEKCNMKTGGCILTFVVLVLSSLPQPGRAQEATQTKPNVSSRDGQHDFDFHIGTWKTHLKRRLHPLTRSNAWVKYRGTTVVRKVWNGRANLVELKADGPAGHFEGLNLRLYNPNSHQWSLNFANI